MQFKKIYNLQCDSKIFGTVQGFQANFVNAGLFLLFNLANFFLTKIFYLQVFIFCYGSLFINRTQGPYREILSPRNCSTDRACEVRA